MAAACQPALFMIFVIKGAFIPGEICCIKLIEATDLFR